VQRTLWRNHSSSLHLGLLTAAGLMSVLTIGCSQTVESKHAVVEPMQSGNVSPVVSGFFGNSYTLLQPGAEGQSAMVYVNPSVQWSEYTKIMLEPVEFWDGADTTVSPSDQLKTDLQANFTLVDQGSPEVLVLQIALTNATTATPGLRSVSVLIPQARILNGLQSLATGSYAFVGSAEGEMKATDSVTGQLLVAAVDKRAGGMALSSAAQWQWGDAENAMNYWSEKINNRLLELQGRTPAAAK
jgi:hypothetical protein